MTIILDEYLVINGVPLATPNCKCVDVLPLTGWVARHTTRRLPGAPGTRNTSPIRDEIVETLEVKLRGDIDEDGAPIADPRSGLRLLIASLRASITGTQDAELHLVGSTTGAEVTVNRFDPVTTGPMTATLMLQVVVPAGEFV